MAAIQRTPGRPDGAALSHGRPAGGGAQNEGDLIRLQASDALVLVDLQNDFLPGGALPVRDSGHVIAAANRALALFRTHRLPVFATRCWHPPNHCSFHRQGGPWPVHCVQDTLGAAFPAALQLPPDVGIVSKAVSPDQDTYSAFDGTPLAALLEEAGIDRLFIAGLATEYCVLETVNRALALHYAVIILADAIAAIDAHVGDGALALARMREAGAIPIRSTNLVD